MEGQSSIGVEDAAGGGLFTSSDPFVHVVQCKAAKVLCVGPEGEPGKWSTKTRWNRTDRRSLDRLTKLREKESDTRTFANYVQRACHILAEEGMAQDHLVTSRTIETPCGECTGFFAPDFTEMCAVSILRSGDLVLDAVQKLEPGIAVGKILIQRDEEDPEKRPKLFYAKLPKDFEKFKVLLVDPMLATGGSALKALEVLVEKGARPENITFLNMIACPEGIRALREAYPQVHIVTLAIDEKLNENKYIVPGIGDCGDRAFGTV